MLLLVTMLNPGCSVADDLVEEARAVTDFHGIYAGISGRITLERGSEEGLTIEAKPDTLERIITEVDEGMLRIRQESPGWWRDSGPIRIHVTYRDLDRLEMSGSADLDSDDLHADEFAIRISGSSNVAIPALSAQVLVVAVSGSGDLDVDDLDAEAAEVSVSGSGDVQLAGRTESLSVRVNGSGNVDTTELAAAEAEVTVSGSGDVDLWAEDALRVRISGSGDVAYRGQPELTRQISGSGDLKRL